MSQRQRGARGRRRFTEFRQQTVSELIRRQGRRVSSSSTLPMATASATGSSWFRSIARSGRRCSARFAGWRVGLVTSEQALAKATGLPFIGTPLPVLHGGLRVMLFRTDRLG